MEDKMLQIPIMTSLIPVCYKDFRCLMGECQDNCCMDGWEISFSKADYLSMRREDAPAEFKEKLDRAVVRFRGEALRDHPNHYYAHLRLGEDGVCPLLGADRLCSLQKVCGEAALPEICASFPRRTAYTAAAREFTLSTGCEGVLKLLWEHPEGLDFVEEELNSRDYKHIVVDTSARTLVHRFGDIRSVCVDIIQDRALPLARRMVLLGLAMRDLCAMDWERPELDGWLRRYELLSQGDAAAEVLGALRGDRELFLRQNITVAWKLRNFPWARELLKAMGADLSTGREISGEDVRAMDRYAACEAVFAEHFGDIEWFFEDLIVAVLWHLNYPDAESSKTLWDSYVELCCLYGFYRFAAVAGCGERPARERLFHCLAMASRATIHIPADERRGILRDSYFEQIGATLPHMAVLVDA